MSEPPADRDHVLLKATVRAFLAAVTTLLVVVTVWTLIVERPGWVFQVLISLAWGVVTFGWMASFRALR